MELPISQGRWDRLVRAVRSRLPKAAGFYIGRTCDLIRRREDHADAGTGCPDFDCMVRLDTFRTVGICAQVESLLIAEFGGYIHRKNLRAHGGGGCGSGEQHLYLMWRTKHALRS